MGRRSARVNNTPARQVIGKVPTRRLAPLKTLNLYACRLGLDRILTQPRAEFLKLQFQLIEESLAALLRSERGPNMVGRMAPLIAAFSDARMRYIVRIEQ
jgi:hypothetical protein